MTGCGAPDLQINQGWIQIKGVHPLYQLQVVLGDDDVKITLTKPRKWSTQSTMFET
jgi:hypothetical protein